MWAKFGMRQLASGLRLGLRVKFHLGCCTVAHAWQKNRWNIEISTKFSQFVELLYPSPLLIQAKFDKRQWTHGPDPRSTLTRQISSESVHCVSCNVPGSIAQFSPNVWLHLLTEIGSCLISDHSVRESRAHCNRSTLHVFTISAYTLTSSTNTNTIQIF